MKGIATLTMNPSLDMSCSVERVSADRKLRAEDLRREPGGGGINVSRAVKELGGVATAIYLAGGPLGDMLETLLDGQEIRQRPISIAAHTRENVTVLERETDKQYRFVMPGPEVIDEETERCFRELFSGFSRPDFLLASGSLPPGVPEEFYARAAAEARGRRIRFILDTRGEPLRLALKEGLYLAKPNLRELREATGKPLEKHDQVAEAARGLVEDGAAEVVVVSLGADGVVLAQRDGTSAIAAPEVPVKSKVGAGDSMLAGIVLRLAEDKSVAEAVRFGVAAGTAAVTTPGTRLCERLETERLYREMTR